MGLGWALIRGWTLINFFCLYDGRLFEVGANSRLGAYSNKYGSCNTTLKHYAVIVKFTHLERSSLISSLIC